MGCAKVRESKNMAEWAADCFKCREREGCVQRLGDFDPDVTEHVWEDGSYTEAVRRRLASVDGLAEAYEGWRSLREDASAHNSLDVLVMCARAWRAVCNRLVGAFGNAVGRDMGRIEEMALSPWFREDMESIMSAAAAA